MSLKDGSKLWVVTGGAIKFGASTLAFPDGLDYEFPAGWSDLGLLKTQPSLERSSENTTVKLFNHEDITVDGSQTYTFSFSVSQYDYETLKFAFQFDTIGADKGWTPGKKTFEGQLAAFLTTSEGDILLHIPSAKMTSMSKIDFLKGDATELSFTFACNPDARLDDGAPFKWFDSITLTPQAPPAP